MSEWADGVNAELQRREDRIVELTEEGQRIATTVLALVVAAGGRVVCKPFDVMALSGWKLVVTEDVASGVKTYEAIRVSPEQV